MTTAVEALPDDPDMLKEMLLAERAESERLRQIIKELQRHRFGRRAETLPEEQLQLGLEEAEQIEAAGQAESEVAAPAERTTRAAGRTGAHCRPICRGSKRWSTWRA
jgi:transposase